jgi:hypothetical protein
MHQALPPQAGLLRTVIVARMDPYKLRFILSRAS